MSATILAVDDVPQNLLAMQALLQRPGLEVDDFHEALRMNNLADPDDVALALLDVQMPEMV